jgi:hypothetical protein
VRRPFPHGAALVLVAVGALTFGRMTAAPSTSTEAPRVHVPAAVLVAMESGRACWTETDYRLRGGNVDGGAAEWYCRGGK